MFGFVGEVDEMRDFTDKIDFTDKALLFGVVGNVMKMRDFTDKKQTLPTNKDKGRFPPLFNMEYLDLNIDQFITNCVIPDTHAFTINI